MARTFYIPINSLSKQTKQWYIPVNGLSKKVSKAYCPVNGLSKLFWDSKGWRREADIPYNLMQGCAVAYHGKIHLFGGDSSDIRTYHYTWDGGTWTRVTDIPTGMAYPSAVVFGGCIHVISGRQHYTWDDSVGWTHLNALNDRVVIAGNCHAIVYNGALTLVSSNSGNYGWWRYVCTWDATTDSWTYENVVGGAVYYNAAALNNLVYLLGSTNVSVYKIWDGTDMVDGESMYNFKYGSTVNYNGKIHLLGTQAGAGQELNKRHYAFDGDTFDEKEKTPYPFYYGSACVFRGRIHIFGAYLPDYQTQHWSYGENVNAIFSNLYPDANVTEAGTISKNNGSRTPVTKPNEGDGVCFISKNGLGTGWGGNWIVTCCIALSRDAALLTAPNVGNNVTSHVINGVTYWIGLQATNGSWGGGTQVENPLGLPIYDDLYICPVNASPSTARVAELIELLGIEVTD